jgi:hypothetical protein
VQSISAKELELLGEYDEVTVERADKRKSYKKQDADIYLYWCDEREGEKHSYAWWFSRKIGSAECLSFAPVGEKDEFEKTPPKKGWQGLPEHFFAAPTLTPIEVIVQPPPPPSIADYVHQVEDCGAGCLKFVKELSENFKTVSKKQAVVAKEKAADMYTGTKEMIKNPETAKGKAKEAKEKAKERAKGAKEKVKEKAREKAEIVRTKSQEMIEKATPAIEQAKSKAKEVAQDFQDNQWPVIKKQAGEAADKYGPVVKEGVASLCTQICDCLNPSGPAAISEKPQGASLETPVLSSEDAPKALATKAPRTEPTPRRDPEPKEAAEFP